MTVQTIVNPLTNRPVRVGGRTYQKLMALKVNGKWGVEEHGAHSSPKRAAGGRRLTVKRRSRSRSSSRSKSSAMAYLERGAPMPRLNRTNIIWRTNKGRKSPRFSATQFRVGYAMTGVDGRLWHVVTARNGVKRWAPAK